MRDPKRIDDFCDRLKAVWHTVPDWRFGQLMVRRHTRDRRVDEIFPEIREKERTINVRI